MPFDPSTAKPDESAPLLVPAIKAKDGKIISGDLGDHHDDIDASGQRGFVDRNGKFLNRKEAGKVAKDAGLDVPDNLHSENLNQALGVEPRKPGFSFDISTAKPLEDASERLSATQFIGNQVPKVVGGFVKDVTKPAADAWETLKADFEKALPGKTPPKDFWDSAKQDFSRMVATGKLPVDAFALVMSPVSGLINATGGRAVSNVMNVLASPTGQKMSPEEAGGILSMGMPGKGYGVAGPSAAAQAAKINPVWAAGRSEGYALHPAEAALAGADPGVVPNTLAMIGGKIKTEQAASVQNQAISNRIAKDTIGVPQSQPLDDATIEGVMKRAADAYRDMENSASKLPGGMVDGTKGKAGADFMKKINDLDQVSDEFRRDFPDLAEKPDVAELKKMLLRPEFSPKAGVAAIRDLRKDASTLLRSMDDPKKLRLGLAKRDAANALEELIEDRLTEAGDTKTVDAYREARKTIAQTHDVQDATDPLGNIDARKLGAMSEKRPLSGGLKVIADMGKAFPRSMQNAAKVGGNEKMSVNDWRLMLGAGAASIASGHPAIALASLAPLAQPLARGALLSDRIQNRLAGLAVKPNTMLPNAVTANALANLTRGGQGNPMLSGPGMQQGQPMPAMGPPAAIPNQ